MNNSIQSQVAGADYADAGLGYIDGAVRTGAAAAERIARSFRTVVV